MPKLPSVLDMGARPTPQAALRPVGYDTSRVGAGAANLGKKMVQVGDDMYAEQQKNALAQAQQAAAELNNFASDMLYNPETGLMNRKGLDAADVQKMAREMFSQKRAEIGARITNPMAQRAFNLDAMNRSSDIDRTTGAYSAQQMDGYRREQNKAFVESETNAAIQGWSGPESVQSNIIRAENAIVAQGQLDGVSEAVMQTRIADMKSSILSAGIGKTALTDPMAAQRYFEQHRGDMNATDTLRIESALKPLVTAQTAQDIFTALHTKQTGQGISPLASDSVFAAAINTVVPGESGGNPNAVNPKTGAFGQYQLLPSTAAQYGVTPQSSQEEHTAAVVKLWRDNANTFVQRVGRNPTIAELSLMHQQGATGGIKLLTASPDAKAVDVVGSDAVLNNHGTAAMTAQEFASKVMSYYGNSSASRDDILRLSNGNTQVAAQVMQLQREQVKAENDARKAALESAVDAAYRFENENRDNPNRRSTPEWRQIAQQLNTYAPEMLDKFNGQDVETDWASYQDVLSRINAGEKVNVMDYKDRLSNGDMKALIDRQADPEVGLRSRLTESVVRDLKPILEAGAEDAAQKARQVLAFSDRLDLNIRDYMRMNGGKVPGRQEVRAMADQLIQTVSVTTPGGGWVGDSVRNARRFEAGPGERSDIPGIPRLARNVQTGRNEPALFVIKGEGSPLTYDALISRLSSDLAAEGFDSSNTDVLASIYDSLVSEGLIEVKTQ